MQVRRARAGATPSAHPHHVKQEMLQGRGRTWDRQLSNEYDWSLATLEPEPLRLPLRISAGPLVGPPGCRR
eukprot:4933543-Pyramimonas_sp.AAC.1